MKSSSLERWSPLILLVVCVAVWELLCRVFQVSEFVFPSPSRILEQTIEYRQVIGGHAWRTFWVTMVGFGLAIVVGVLLGFVIGSSRLAYASIYPLMTAFNALPKAAFVPILVVWFGIGIGPAILTAFLISFFPIVIDAAVGLRSMSSEMTDLAPEQRSTLMQVVCKVEAVVRRALQPHKVNLASLGNVVPHLHWHIVARWTDDPHFPQPIWGERQRSASNAHLMRLEVALPQVDRAIQAELMSR